MKTDNPDSEGVMEPQGISISEYNRLICAIHDGSFDDQALTRALDMVRQQFAANFVTLILRIPEVEDIGLMLVSGDIEAQGRVTRLTYHRRRTPFSNQPADKVFTQQDVLSASEWEASDYYQEYCLQQDVYHVMGADISTESEGTFRFRITRSKRAPAFDSNDKALCTLLLPHIRHALQVHNLIGRSESLGAIYADAINRLSVATILLTETGTVQKLNDYARQLLEHADGLKLVGDRLEASYPSDNKELQKRIKEAFEARARGEALSGEALSVTRPSGEVNLGIVLEAIPDAGWIDDKDQPTLLLYVRDAVNKSTVSSAAAKQLFDFTPAETALALELANGLSLEDAAESLGIMRNTARAHLRAIFSKTGVRRQAELVRVMLNSVVALSADVPGAVAGGSKALGPEHQLKPLKKGP
ncbi:helix-turn-helix transcriptional regulator [Marinobacter sp. X15-166B]|uniref:helix-turn-helix transcriptional regulator n=1 Tax=Marinobacter sp. X15-166B TaxID=1897620 RepID=UPI00085C6C91|nr:helix-turn-helix transcriptional regulator [Marinobacter sp. X15-166B]OEY66331.1 helix-turn-helix transcriptional regulator [Marinobacter sp. X15-166B]